MIIKNITFVVPVTDEADFLSLVFHATDSVNQWVDDIKTFKLTEQVDPESYNFAVQLGFDDKKKLLQFDEQLLEQLIGQIQSGLTEPLLYFESHLEKIF